VTNFFVLLILPGLLYGNLNTKRGNLAMLKSVCVLFFVLFVAPLASAEIFKCMGKSGEDLYQNFPCQFESIGWISTDAQGPKKSPGSPAEPRLGVGPKKSPTAPAEPRIGMTTEEVRAIWTFSIVATVRRVTPPSAIIRTMFGYFEKHGSSVSSGTTL
jgi:hypothetical protein